MLLDSPKKAATDLIIVSIFRGEYSYVHFRTSLSAVNGSLIVKGIRGIQVAIVPNREWYAVGIVVHHFYELISDHEVYFRFYIDYRGLCYVAGIVYTPCKSSPCNSKAYNNTGNDTNDFGSSTVLHIFKCPLSLRNNQLSF